MRSQIAFFVAYKCPHCGVALEAEDDGWNGWRRCPACARLALPPRPDPRLRLSRSAGRDTGSSALANREVNGIAGSNDADPEALLLTQTVSSPVVGPARLIVKTAFILSLALLLLFYLEQNTRSTAIFGALAVIFFFLLLRLPRKSRERGGL